MFEKKNMRVANIWYSYMLQPGDGTLYRFGFCYYPDDMEECYVLDSGVNRTDYIKVFINMPGGHGIGAVPLFQLKSFPEYTHMLGYLAGVGFNDVYPYTLIACLLALKVLVPNPGYLEEAAKAMLQAQEIVIRIQGADDDK
jgi:hypothetical protein